MGIASEWMLWENVEWNYLIDNFLLRIWSAFYIYTSPLQLRRRTSDLDRVLQVTSAVVVHVACCQQDAWGSRCPFLCLITIFQKKIIDEKNPYFEAHFYDIIWCILMYFVSIFTGRTYQTLTSEWHPNCQLQSSLTKCTAQWCWLLFMPNGKPYRVNRKQ